MWVKTTYPDQLDYWGGCAGRESNPGLVRGRDVYYHCTTGALLPWRGRAAASVAPVGAWRGAPRAAIASIAQLAEHALSKRKVTSSILVGGCISDMV